MADGHRVAPGHDWARTFFQVFSVIGGAEVAGLLGALFAAPTVALVVTLVDAAIKERRGDADQIPEVAVAQTPVAGAGLPVRAEVDPLPAARRG